MFAEFYWGGGEPTAFKKSKSLSPIQIARIVRRASLSNWESVLCPEPLWSSGPTAKLQ